MVHTACGPQRARPAGAHCERISAGRFVRRADLDVRGRRISAGEADWCTRSLHWTTGGGRNRGRGEEAGAAGGRGEEARVLQGQDENDYVLSQV